MITLTEINNNNNNSYILFEKYENDVLVSKYFLAPLDNIPDDVLKDKSLLIKYNSIFTDEVKTKYQEYLESLKPSEEEIEAKRQSEIMSMTLSPRQMRLVLLKNGLLKQVEEAIADNDEMKIWWEYALTIYRNNENIIVMAKMFGIDDESLNQLFVDGAKL